MGVPGCDAAVPKAEVLALFDLYAATNVTGWTSSTNWLAGDPCENEWYGVTCDETNSSVTQL